MSERVNRRTIKTVGLTVAAAVASAEAKTCVAVIGAGIRRMDGTEPAAEWCGRHVGQFAAPEIPSALCHSAVVCLPFQRNCGFGLSWWFPEPSECLLQCLARLVQALSLRSQCFEALQFSAN